MIRSELGRVELRGSAINLCADLGSAVDALNTVFSSKFGKDEAKKLIMDAVESGFEDIAVLKEKVEAMEAEALAEHLECMAKAIRKAEGKENGSEQ